MIPKGIGGDIRISVRGVLSLRTGDLVSLNVLKELAPHKWAVGLQGRVLPASSRLDLEPGTTVRARVTLQGKGIVFTLLNEGSPVLKAAASAAARPDASAAATHLSHVVAAALLRSGQGAQEEVVEKIRTLVSRSTVKKEKAARSYAEILDKGIDVSSPGAEKIVQGMAFGEKGGRERRRYREKPFPDDASAVKAAVGSASSERPNDADVLAAFNHVRSSNQSWVVIPFLFRDGGDVYPGTMKILYDPFTRKPLRFALSVAPNDGDDLSFYLKLEGAKKLSLFGSRKMRRAAEGGLWRFAAKLRNMGIEVDDTIHGEEDFDGFSPVWEGAAVKRIDTVG